MKHRKLTKNDLISMGIDIQIDSNEPCGFKITHQSKLRLNKTELHPTKSIKKHKFGKTITYYLVGWSELGKSITFPLQRVIYAWYYDLCPADKDVDHVDNDTLNNHPDNLQLLTRAENLAKRYEKNNQYTARK